MTKMPRNAIIVYGVKVNGARKVMLDLLDLFPLQYNINVGSNHLEKPLIVTKVFCQVEVMGVRGLM